MKKLTALMLAAAMAAGRAMRVSAAKDRPGRNTGPGVRRRGSREAGGDCGRGRKRDRGILVSRGRREDQRDLRGPV